jgi:hypothetical protein
MVRHLTLVKKPPPARAGYFGLMEYMEDFQDQQMQLLKEQRKKQKSAASPPHRSGNSGQADGPGQNS